MPELPDVELARRWFQEHARGRRVVAVEARSTRILAGTSGSDLQRALAGHAFAQARRHGKHLLATIAGGGVLGIHFGMTGELRAVTDGEPPATRLLLRFASGPALAYVDPRQIGRIGLADDVDAYIRAHRLGPDALDAPVAAVAERWRGQRGGLKAALMDQALVAGIGNVYADEICFRQRLHPLIRLATLAPDAVLGLAQAAQDVLAEAIAHHGDRAHMPAGWLMPHRQGGSACPRCGGRLDETTVAGRTTVLCPHCQPAPELSRVRRPARPTRRTRTSSARR